MQLDRRKFAQSLGGAAISAAAVRSLRADAPIYPATAPFPLSIMLWTVWTDLPFEQRLANVAEAGYSNVELVGEYAKWTDADFDRAQRRAQTTRYSL